MSRIVPLLVGVLPFLVGCAQTTSPPAAVAAKPGAKGPELVAYPEGYATKFTNYGSVDRANPKQIADLWINDVGARGLKANGTLPSGTVLVMEVHNAKLNGDQPVVVNGRRVKDGLGTVSVMEKRAGWGAGYPAELRNGEWEYAAYDPTTKQLRSMDTKACFECHAKGPGAAKDWVFSSDKLPR